MMVDLLCWYGVEEVEYCIVVFDIYWYMGGIYLEWCVYMVFVILLLFYYIMIGVKFMYWCDLDVGCYLGFVFVWWQGLWCGYLLLFWKVIGVVLCYFKLGYMLYYEGLIEQVFVYFVCLLVVQVVVYGGNWGMMKGV